MERVYDAKLVIQGDDSSATAKDEAAAEDCAEQTPQGMSEDQFENELWMLNDGWERSASVSWLIRMINITNVMIGLLYVQ